MWIPNLYNCSLILDDDEKVFDRLADLKDRFDILNALEVAAKENRTASIIYCCPKDKMMIIVIYHPELNNPLLDHATTNHLSLFIGPNLQQLYQVFYSWYHYFIEIDKLHPGVYLSESIMKELYELQKNFVEKGVHYYHY